MKQLLLTLMLSFFLTGLGSNSNAAEYDFGKTTQYANDEASTWSMGQRSIVTKKKNVYIVSGSINDTIIFTKSMDGGKTFQNPLQIGEGWAPSIALGKDGTIYAVFSRNIPYITKSTDEGATFSTPIYVGSGVTASVTVDDNGDVYVATMELHGGLNIFRSIDGGATFAHLNFPNISYDRNPVITAKEGALYVVWTKRGNVYFASSKDGGNTFSGTTMVSQSQGFASDSDAPCLAVDNDSNIYIAWDATMTSTTGATSAYKNLYIARSIDKGATFAVNKIDTKGDSPMFPSIATDIVDNVYLAWTDSISGRQWDVYFTFSDTVGETFSSPIQVSQGNIEGFNPPTIAVNDTEDALIAFGKYLSKSVHCTE